MCGDSTGGVYLLPACVCRMAARRCRIVLRAPAKAGIALARRGGYGGPSWVHIGAELAHVVRNVVRLPLEQIPSPKTRAIVVMLREGRRAALKGCSGVWSAPRSGPPGRLALQTQGSTRMAAQGAFGEGRYTGDCIAGSVDPSFGNVLRPISSRCQCGIEPRRSREITPWKFPMYAIEHWPARESVAEMPLRTRLSSSEAWCHCQASP